MGAKIKNVYALIDWHNVQKNVAPNFHANPRRHIPQAIFAIQQQIVQTLAFDGGSKYRVTLRIYHGWHQGREPTPLRRDFESLASDPSLARRMGSVSFSKGLQFGNELVCHDGQFPLYSTHRNDKQKMVDSAIVCDLLHLLRYRYADRCIIVSDDDDYIPALLTAKAWSADVVLLRRSGHDIGHVTDIDCSKELMYWSVQ